MNQHQRQNWPQSDTSQDAVGSVLFWIAFVLFDAVLWGLIYRLGEWALRWG